MLHPIKAKPVIITGVDNLTGFETGKALLAEELYLAGVFESKCTYDLQNVFNELCKINNIEERLPTLISLATALKQSQGVKPLLLLSQDEWVVWASERSRELSLFVDIILPPADIVKTHMNKSEFYEWAIKYNFPVPKTLALSSESELKLSVSCFSGPFIIKPQVRNAAWNQKFDSKKLFYFSSIEDFNQSSISWGEVFEYSQTIIIQDWLGGKDHDVYFVLMAIDSSNTVIGSFTGQKLLQWPRLSGSTACCVGAHRPDLENTAKILATSANYQGLCSVEFKFDPERNKFYITEPTVGRNDFQSFVATLNGMNLTRLLVNSHFNHNQGLRLNRSKNKNIVWVEGMSLIRALIARDVPFFVHWKLIYGICRNRVKGLNWGNLFKLTLKKVFMGRIK